MDRQHISSGSPFERSIGFSRAVRVGNFLAVSGTAPIAEDGGTAAPGDPYGQTVRCIEIIQKAIEAAGGSLEHVVRTRLYLTDTQHWEEVARAHGAFFADIRPASTMIVVGKLLDPGWFIEMEADCILP